MRYFLFTMILLANFSFADYSSHPEAKELIDASGLDVHSVVEFQEAADKVSEVLA